MKDLACTMQLWVNDAYPEVEVTDVCKSFADTAVKGTNKPNNRRNNSMLDMSPETLSNVLSFLTFDDASVLAATMAEPPEQYPYEGGESSLYKLPVWREIFVRRGFSLQDPIPNNDYYVEYQRRNGLCERFMTPANAMRMNRPRFVPFAWLQSMESMSKSVGGYSDDDSDNESAILSTASTSRNATMTHHSWGLGSTATSPELIVLEHNVASHQVILTVHSNPFNDEFLLRRTESDINSLTTSGPFSGFTTPNPESSRKEPIHPFYQVLLPSDTSIDSHHSCVRLLAAKPVFGMDHVITGSTMIAMSWQEQPQQQHHHGSTAAACDGSCTQFRFWHRPEGRSAYTDCGQCVVPGICSWADYSATMNVSHRSVYAMRSRDASTIEAYPITFHGRNKSSNATAALRPVFVMDCKSTVLSCCLCPSGKRLTVVTVNGDLQIWTVNSQGSNAAMTVSIPSHPVVEDAFEGLRNIEFLKAMLGTSTAMLVARRANANAAVTAQQVSIHVPRHLSIEHSGFVTFHTSRDSLETNTTGSHTVLFWEKSSSSSLSRGRGTKATTDPLNGGWGVFALINLPLLLIRQPHVYYDGNRFIALGQDFLGFIILVYQVRDAVSASESGAKATRQERAREGSGGVYNFGSPRLTFANRIRHDIGGGGIERMEQLEMTCNERYLVVRAKTEDPVQHGLPSSSHSDGLLVFDLQDPTSMVEPSEEEFGRFGYC